MDDQEAYYNFMELLMMDQNLFRMGIQLHDKSILQLTNENDQLGDTIGSILLGKTKMSIK